MTARNSRIKCAFNAGRLEARKQPPGALIHGRSDRAARAFIPAALVPAAAILAVPVVAQSASSDMAKLRSHISSVQSMTASSTDRSARPDRDWNDADEAARQVRFVIRAGSLLSPMAGLDLRRLYRARVELAAKPHAARRAFVQSPISRPRQGHPRNDPRVVTVEARDPTQYGSIRLVFLRSASAPGGLQLYGWTAIDAQKKRTTVSSSTCGIRCLTKALSLRRAEKEVSQSKLQNATCSSSRQGWAPISKIDPT